MPPIPKDRMLAFRGQDLHDQEGGKIGSIEEMYLDADTGVPEWALVDTGLFGTKRHFVPLRDATEADGDLRVPLESGKVKDAPTVDPDGQLTTEEERELYAFYGMPDAALAAAAAGDEGGDEPVDESEDAPATQPDEDDDGPPPATPPPAA